MRSRGRANISLVLLFHGWLFDHYAENNDQPRSVHNNMTTTCLATSKRLRESRQRIFVDPAADVHSSYMRSSAHFKKTTEEYARITLQKIRKNKKISSLLLSFFLRLNIHYQFRHVQ
jgi:ABC-type oligopeptide transport system ATPase subunit